MIRFHAKGVKTTDAHDGIYLNQNGLNQKFLPTIYQMAMKPLRFGMYHLDLQTFAIDNNSVRDTARQILLR
ncbi:MAG: hypothetical protein M2R45_01343 [Verrucomicrobia subdivision 3 bacterium]|nr:hypothetical protein [Limisphaerales bacterium]MCS1415208.1 hypothetical protein [Limisphaerales bacterium]